MAAEPPHRCDSSQYLRCSSRLAWPTWVSPNQMDSRKGTMICLKWYDITLYDISLWLHVLKLLHVENYVVYIIDRIPWWCHVLPTRHDYDHGFVFDDDYAPIYAYTIYVIIWRWEISHVCWFFWKKPSNIGHQKFTAVPWSWGSTMLSSCLQTRNYFYDRPKQAASFWTNHTQKWRMAAWNEIQPSLAIKRSSYFKFSFAQRPHHCRTAASGGSSSPGIWLVPVGPPKLPPRPSRRGAATPPRTREACLATASGLAKRRILKQNAWSAKRSCFFNRTTNQNKGNSLRFKRQTCWKIWTNRSIRVLKHCQ